MPTITQLNNNRFHGHPTLHTEPLPCYHTVTLPPRPSHPSGSIETDPTLCTNRRHRHRRTGGDKCHSSGSVTVYLPMAFPSATPTSPIRLKTAQEITDWAVSTITPHCENDRHSSSYASTPLYATMRSSTATAAASMQPVFFTAGPALRQMLASEALLDWVSDKKASSEWAESAPRPLSGVYVCVTLQHALRPPSSFFPGSQGVLGKGDSSCTANGSEYVWDAPLMAVAGVEGGAFIPKKYGSACDGPGDNINGSCCKHGRFEDDIADARAHLSLAVSQGASRDAGIHGECVPPFRYHQRCRTATGTAAAVAEEEEGMQYNRHAVDSESDSDSGGAAAGGRANSANRIHRRHGPHRASHGGGARGGMEEEHSDEEAAATGVIATTRTTAARAKPNMCQALVHPPRLLSSESITEASLDAICMAPLDALVSDQQLPPETEAMLMQALCTHAHRWLHDYFGLHISTRSGGAGFGGAENGIARTSTAHGGASRKREETMDASTVSPPPPPPFWIAAFVRTPRIHSRVVSDVTTLTLSLYSQTQTNSAARGRKQSDDGLPTRHRGDGNGGDGGGSVPAVMVPWPTWVPPASVCVNVLGALHTAALGVLDSIAAAAARATQTDGFIDPLHAEVANATRGRKLEDKGLAVGTCTGTERRHTIHNDEDLAARTSAFTAFTEATFGHDTVCNALRHFFAALGFHLASKQCVRDVAYGYHQYRQLQIAAQSHPPQQRQYRERSRHVNVAHSHPGADNDAARVVMHCAYPHCTATTGTTTVGGAAPFVKRSSSDIHSNPSGGGKLSLSSAFCFPSLRELLHFLALSWASREPFLSRVGSSLHACLAQCGAAAVTAALGGAMTRSVSTAATIAATAAADSSEWTATQEQEVRSVCSLRAAIAAFVTQVPLWRLWWTMGEPQTHVSNPRVGLLLTPHPNVWESNTPAKQAKSLPLSEAPRTGKDATPFALRLPCSRTGMEGSSPPPSHTNGASLFTERMRITVNYTAAQCLRWFLLNGANDADAFSSIADERHYQGGTGSGEGVTSIYDNFTNVTADADMVAYGLTILPALLNQFLLPQEITCALQRALVELQRASARTVSRNDGGCGGEANRDNANYRLRSEAVSNRRTRQAALRYFLVVLCWLCCCPSSPSSKSDAGTEMQADSGANAMDSVATQEREAMAPPHPLPSWRLSAPLTAVHPTWEAIWRQWLLPFFALHWHALWWSAVQPFSNWSPPSGTPDFPTNSPDGKREEEEKAAQRHVRRKRVHVDVQQPHDNDEEKQEDDGHGNGELMLLRNAHRTVVAVAMHYTGYIGHLLRILHGFAHTSARVDIGARATAKSKKATPRAKARSMNPWKRLSDSARPVAPALNTDTAEGESELAISAFTAGTPRDDGRSSTGTSWWMAAVPDVTSTFDGDDTSTAATHSSVALTDGRHRRVRREKSPTDNAAPGSPDDAHVCSASGNGSRVGGVAALVTSLVAHGEGREDPFPSLTGRLGRIHKTQLRALRSALDHLTKHYLPPAHTNEKIGNASGNHIARTKSSVADAGGVKGRVPNGSVVDVSRCLAGNEEEQWRDILLSRTTSYTKGDSYQYLRGVLPPWVYPGYTLTSDTSPTSTTDADSDLDTSTDSLSTFSSPSLLLLLGASTGQSNRTKTETPADTQLAENSRHDGGCRKRLPDREGKGRTPLGSRHRLERGGEQRGRPPHPTTTIIAMKGDGREDGTDNDKREAASADGLFVERSLFPSDPSGSIASLSVSSSASTTPPTS